MKINEKKIYICGKQYKRKPDLWGVLPELACREDS